MTSEFQPLRVGLIGCGGMGVRHARAVAEMRANGCRPVEVVAVCDIDPGRRATVAALLAADGGIPPAEHAELYALLDDAAVEAAIIVLPTSMHHTTILAALSAGKHVLVEKPLALTVAACDLIAAAAAQADRVIAVAENYRRIASNRAFGALLRAGRFGLVDAMFVRNIASPEPPVPPGEAPKASPLWYRDRTRAGGYHVLEMGVHEADLQHVWFGPVQRVEAQTRLFDRVRSGQRHPSEDLLTASFGFADGLSTHITFCSTIRDFEAADRLTVGRDVVVTSAAWHAWERGEARFADGRRERSEALVAEWLRGLDDATRDRLLPAGAWSVGAASVATEPLSYGVGLAIHDFARAVRLGLRPEIDVDSGRRAVATCCAMLEAAERGGAIDVDDVLSGAVASAQRPLNEALGIDAAPPFPPGASERGKGGARPLSVAATLPRS